MASMPDASVTELLPPLARGQTKCKGHLLILRIFSFCRVHVFSIHCNKAIHREPSPAL